MVVVVDVVVVVVDVDAETNRRVSCNKAMEATKEHCVWFGMEQEYCLLATDGYPYRWPKSGFPRPQGEPADEPTAAATAVFVPTFDVSVRVTCHIQYTRPHTVLYMHYTVSSNLWLRVDDN